MNSQHQRRDRGRGPCLAALLLVLALLAALALPGTAPAQLPSGPAAEALAEAGPHAPPAAPDAAATATRARTAPRPARARAPRHGTDRPLPRRHRPQPPSRAPPALQRKAPTATLLHKAQDMNANLHLALVAGFFIAVTIGTVATMILFPV